MSVEKAKALATEISAVMAGKELAVCATALAEVMAILIVWTAEDDTRAARKRFAVRLAKQAVELADAITLDMLTKAVRDNEEADRKRATALLEAAGPKRKSPWGEVR